MPSTIIDQFAATFLESAESAAKKLFDEETADKVIDTVENAMLPYVIAAGSFAYGVVFPEGRQVKAEAPVQAVVPANSSRGSVAPVFFCGMRKSSSAVSSFLRILVTSLTKERINPFFFFRSI